MVNGHIPLPQEKQDVELNEATETVFLNFPCGVSPIQALRPFLQLHPHRAVCLGWGP